MALLSDNQSMAKCPKCGASGPFNFRFEQRVTLKNADSDKQTVLNVQNTTSVYACIKCSAVIQNV